MDLHLDIQSNTAPHIKHKAQLNYAEFTAIIFIKWQHSSGQAIQMLLHTYISHCSLILCGTAPLAFGHSCWKSCEMILKKMWKTSPDRHWDGAVTGDRQLVRQKQSCHPVQPAMIIPLFWQEDWLLLSTCSDKTNMCQTHPCVFCSSATEWETFSLHHSLSKPPVAAESLLSPWEHIQDCFCPSLRTSQIRWSCSSWGHPAQLRTPSTTEDTQHNWGSPVEGKAPAAQWGWFICRAAVPGALRWSVQRDWDPAALPTWHFIQADRTSPLLN